MGTILTPDGNTNQDTVNRDAAGRPMLQFKDMDPVQVAADQRLKDAKLKQEYDGKAAREALDRDKHAAYLRYQEYVNRQGGVDVLALGWTSENWYEKFTEWEAKEDK